MLLLQHAEQSARSDFLPLIMAKGFSEARSGCAVVHPHLVWVMCQPIPLKLRQHCMQVLGDEPEYSSCHGRVIATLDYIWYSEGAYTPCGSAARLSGSHAGSLSSISGWSPLKSIASPIGSKGHSSSGAAQSLGSPEQSSKGRDGPASARGLGSPVGSSEGRSSLMSTGSSQTAVLADRLSELNGDSQAGRGVELPGPILAPKVHMDRLLDR